MIPPPDLISYVPTVRIDMRALRQTLVFAFAAGCSTEAFDDVVAAMALAESSWNRESFARDLYLNDLVSRCLAVTVAGQPQATCVRYLTRVVGTPPRDVRDVETRRAVLCELSSSVRAR